MSIRCILYNVTEASKRSCSRGATHMAYTAHQAPTKGLYVRWLVLAGSAASRLRKDPGW